MRDPAARRPAPARPTVEGQRGPQEEALFSAPLLAHHRREFVAGWRSVRDGGPDERTLQAAEREFKETILHMPGARGRRRAEELAEHEAVVERVGADDWTALLAHIDDRSYEARPEDVSREAAEAALRPRRSGGSVNGVLLAAGETAPVDAGLTIHFGTGVHALRERELRGEDGQGLPSDVTISGAGMDATLLRIGDISIRGDVERLRFQNLTLDCENDGLFDLRTGSLTLRLDRVRVVRFDAAHGGCYVLSVTDGCYVWASDCEFVGGYGDSPGRGSLFRFGVGVARFERCRFDRLSLSLPRSTGSQVLFEGCEFDRLRGASVGWQEHEPDFVRFVGCSFGAPLELPRRPETVPLSTLFPELHEDD